MTEWQPIETAPKDNKSRLIWCPDNMSIYCVSWVQGDDGYHRQGWHIFGGDWRHHLQSATHWMPLPEPPK
jgi:hypothetical protein